MNKTLIPKRILISGSYGTGNCGDEVILESLLQVFSHHHITVLSQGPAYTKTHFDQVRVVPQTLSFAAIRIVKDICKLRFKNIYHRWVFLRELLRCDIFVMGGGGLLSELIPSVLVFYLMQIQIATLLKKQVLIVGVGIGPLHTTKGIKLFAKTIEGKVGLIIVRDEHSLKITESYLTSPKAKLAPDLAFWNKNLYHRARNAQSKKIIFNFYKAFADEVVWPGQVEKYQKLEKIIIAVIKHLIAQGNDVLILPFGTQNDLDYAHYVGELVSSPHCQVYSEQTGYKGVLNQFENARYSITMRFHAGLLSFLQGIPSLCLDQQFKSERLLREMNLPELLIEMPDGIHKAEKQEKFIELEEVLEKVKFIERNYQDISERIDHYCHKQWALAQAAKEELINHEYFN